MQIRTLISESEKAIVWQIGSDFEVWMKLPRTVGKDKGTTIEPKDEDFGVWAWSAYSLEKAMIIANDINTGARTIRPMIEIDN